MKAGTNCLQRIRSLNTLLLAVSLAAAAAGAGAAPTTIKISQEPAAPTAAPEDFLLGNKDNGDGTFTTMRFPMIKPGALGDSRNLWRMTSINALLQNRSGPVNFITFGDSTAEYFRSPQGALLDSLGNLYGTYETGLSDGPNSFWAAATHTGGAAWANSDINFFTGYINLPAGGTSWITNYYPVNGPGTMTMQGIELFWIVQPSGGTFKLQSNRSGTWADETPAINTAGASRDFVATNLLFTPGNVSTFQLKLIGISGVNFLPPPGFIRSLANTGDKIRYLPFGQGGYGLDQLQCYSNTAWTCFKALRPDLFMFKMDHESTWTGVNVQNLLNLLFWVTNSTPACEVLLIGTPPAVVDSPGNEIGNKTLRGLAGTNFMYVDLASQLGQTNLAANDAGLYLAGDNLHFSSGGYWSMLQPFMSFWGWTPSQPSSTRQGIGYGARINRLAIGQGQNTDPAIPFTVSSSWSGGNFGVKPEIGGTGISLFSGANSFLYAAGGAIWNTFSAYKLDLLNGAAVGGYTPAGGAYVGATPGDNLTAGTFTMGNYLLLNTNKSTPRIYARGASSFPAGLLLDNHALLSSAGVSTAKGLSLNANAGFLDNGSYSTPDPTSTGWQLEFDTATAVDRVNLNHATAGGTLTTPFSWIGPNAGIYSGGSNDWNGTQNFRTEVRLAGAAGTLGQVLTSAGAGAVPKWSATPSKYFTGITSYRDLGGFYAAGAQTGTIEIVLPYGWSGTAIFLEISGYDASVKGAWKVIIGGSNSNPWANFSKTITGTAPFTTCRLAFHGTFAVVLLGTMATVWASPSIVVNHVQTSISNITGWDVADWPISVLANETGITSITTAF